MNRTLGPLLLLLACSANERPLTLKGDATATACQAATVQIDGPVDGRSLRVTVAGWPGLYANVEDDVVRFDTPALARDTELTLTLLEDDIALDTQQVQLAAAETTDVWAPGTVAGCAPFHEGVGSAEPTASSVLLWTRRAGGGDLTWEVATTPSFETPLQSGQTKASADADYTVTVEARGLPASTTLYYRFLTPDGVSSPIGRTRTAPTGVVDQLAFAVASCSSLYSGYFNAYRHIASRDVLDGVIHLGDYLYDYVDNEERVRVPTPEPSTPQTLEGWRALHRNYLSDPDFRAARQQHPWLVIWDNHDLELGGGEALSGAIQAFHEYVPIRLNDTNAPDRIYRRAGFGEMLDLILLDTTLHRDGPPGDATQMLGAQQEVWLDDVVDASTAAWRLFGSQKLMGEVKINPSFGPFLGGEREVFDPNAWDGFPASRERFFQRLADAGYKDNVVVSGDSHITAVMDLVRTLSGYDATTGDGSVGVEILPTSISRGNFDETLGQGSDDIIEGLKGDTLARNPHHVHLDLMQHGYGHLVFTPDEMRATVHYMPILEPTDEATSGPTHVVARGDGHWSR